MNQNCWDFWNCGREIDGFKTKECGVCPAYRFRAFNRMNGGFNGGRYCWGVAGTDPIGNTRKTCERAPDIEDCHQCEFYQLVRQEEGPQFHS